MAEEKYVEPISKSEILFPGQACDDEKGSGGAPLDRHTGLYGVNEHLTGLAHQEELNDAWGQKINFEIGSNSAPPGSPAS